MVINDEREASAVEDRYLMTVSDRVQPNGSR